jgi:2,3-bisphosphoglycerate-independent phosphoglycerate mutase
MEFFKKVKTHPKPIVLAILDGWGIYQPYSGNAIALANTPIVDSLIAEYPSMTLRASGEAVGLPWGEMGNSEVGHLNLGLGRILYQDLPRINKEIGNGEFYRNKVLLGAVKHAKANNANLHFMGVVSNGCVHASIDHLHALLVFARQNKLKNVYVHAILDGRDTSFNSGINFIKGIQRSIAEYSVGKIATIAGRFYTMDRNNNWDRTEKAYDAMVRGKGETADDPVSAIEASYKKNIYDEEFMPTVIVDEEKKPVVKISDNDALIFYNYRPDRARQITKAFVMPEFNRFDRTKKINNLYFAAFTEYEKGLPMEVVFPQEDLKNCLGEVLSKAGLKQLRISETEKYAHVTYFFNGGRESKFEGEDHILVPSPAVSNYDQKPEMSALEVTKKIEEAIEEDKYDFILVNYANADMVGHTGDMKATIKAVETLDKCVERLLKQVLSKDGILMLTADHGNAEVMFNMQSGQKDKEHTSNPVPFILAGNEYKGRNFGWQNAVGNDLSLVQPQGILSDVAPTIIKLFNIEKPEEITGISLI